MGKNYNSNKKFSGNKTTNKHKFNYEKQFANPYNFIPTNNEPDRKEVMTSDRFLTGKLSCRVITKTPLAILDTEKVNGKSGEHKKYPFFTIDGTHVIPGSSLRGCIRSVYEILTESCYVTMEDNEVITARMSPKDVNSPGVMIKEDGKWKLYKAEEHKIRGKINTTIQKKERILKNDNEIFCYGECVECNTNEEKIYCSDVKKANQKNSNKYLVIGEPFAKKGPTVFIFEIKKSNPINVTNKALVGFKTVLEEYQDSAINKKLNNGEHSGYKGVERALKEGIVPVWYKYNEQTKTYSLSPAAIGRRMFAKTVNELLDNKYNPCNERKRACPACQLFGMVKGEGMGSKIRISDAFESKAGKSEFATLKELSSPRSGYYPFYSMMGNMFDEKEATISGRKFYWHIPKAAPDKTIYETAEKTARNATVEVVRDTEFVFDIFFNEITQEQLNALKWTISLGENKDDSKLCQKLGHGKPLGLGSVKMVIDSETIRTFSLGQDYKIEKNNKVEIEELPSVLYKSKCNIVKKVFDMNFMKDVDVRYPFVNDKSNGKARANDIASHKWFSEWKELKKKFEKINSETKVDDLLLPSIDFSINNSK